MVDGLHHTNMNTSEVSNNIVDASGNYSAELQRNITNMVNRTFQNLSQNLYDPDEFIPDDILNMVFLPLVVCGGIIGIILTVIVLSCKMMCTSTNCYLTSLAVADLFFLVIMSITIVLEKVEMRVEYLIVTHHYLIILMASCHITSVWITVMLAVERYITICHPLRAMALCTVKRVRIIVFVICVFSFVVRIPNFWDYKYSYIRQYNMWTVTWQEVYNHKWYNFITNGFITAILPFVALMGLNVRLIVEIRRSSRYLQYHLAVDSSIRSVISSEQFKITVMLISIIAAFFVLELPYIVYNAIIAFADFSTDMPRHHMAMMKGFQSVTKIMLALKSSCNFILYCWFSEKFWNTFKTIFCKRCCQPKQMPKGTPDNSHNNVHQPSYMASQETTC